MSRAVVDAGLDRGCGRRRSSRDPRSRAGAAARTAGTARSARGDEGSHGHAHRRHRISPSGPVRPRPADRMRGACPPRLAPPSSPAPAAASAAPSPSLCSHDGYHVALAGRRADALAETRRPRRGRRSRRSPCRPTSPSRTPSARSSIASHADWGRLDLLFNNAGIGAGGAVRGSVVRAVEGGRRRQPDRHVPVRAGRVPR